MHIFYTKIEGAVDWEQGSRLQGGDNLYLIFSEAAPTSGLF